MISISLTLCPILLKCSPVAFVLLKLPTTFKRHLLFGIPYSEIFMNKYYSAFGIQKIFMNKYYSVFGILASEMFHKRLLFGIWYLEILHERIYSVFGIWKCFMNEYYSGYSEIFHAQILFGIRKLFMNKYIRYLV